MPASTCISATGDRRTLVPVSHGCCMASSCGRGCANIGTVKSRQNDVGIQTSALSLFLPHHMRVCRLARRGIACRKNRWQSACTATTVINEKSSNPCTARTYRVALCRSALSSGTDDSHARSSEPFVAIRGTAEAASNLVQLSLMCCATLSMSNFLQVAAGHIPEKADLLTAASYNVSSRTHHDSFCLFSAARFVRVKTAPR